MKKILITSSAVLLCIIFLIYSIRVNASKNSTSSKNINANWKLVWSDEFDGDSIDKSKWNFVEGGGGFGNNELQYYTSRPENARVENGTLIITARREDYGGNKYTSAKLTTQGKGEWTYGKFEIRAKLPEGQGLWPAIWMMPSDMDMYGGWPSCGEIDIMENIGSEPNKVFGTLHYGNPWKYTGKDYYLPDGKKFSDDFHTFELEWLPGEFRWYVDGNLYQVQRHWYSRNLNEADSYTYPAPFDRDFYLQINLAVGGNLPGNPKDDSIFPKSFVIDYVRVYEYKGEYPQINYDYNTVRPTLEDGNYIYNGTFDKDVEGVDRIDGVDGSSYWRFNTLLGGEAIPSIEDGIFKAEILNPGSETYSVQLTQEPIFIEKGAKYRVSFDAKASKPRSIISKVTMVGGSWISYSGDTVINLTTEMKNYSYEFTMKNEADPFARLDFNIGKDDGIVYLDNVKLIKISDNINSDPNQNREPLKSGNYIYNGTFDQGKERLGFWKFEVSNRAKAIISTDNREVYVNIKNNGKSPDDIRLYQEGIKLPSNETYILSFNARSSQPRPLIVSIKSNDKYITKSLTLTREMEKYSFEFSTEDSSDNPYVLQFLFGNDPKDVYLDNIFLKKKAKPVVIDDTKEAIIEAENYHQMFGVLVGPCSDIGGGETVGYIDDGDWMDYIINVKKSGIYTVFFRVSGGFSDKIGKIDIISNGRILSSTDLKYTGSWDTYTTVKTTVELQEGEQILRIYANKGGFNLNYFKFIYGIVSENDDTSSNLIKNGNFDLGSEYWIHFKADWDGAYSVAAVENGEMKVTIYYEGPQFWSTQIAQSNLSILKGETYELSFDARSSVVRDIQVMIERNGGDYAKYFGPQTITLTPEMRRFNFVFTMNSETDEVAHIVFALGKIGDANIIGNHEVYLDNITLIKK